MGRLAGASPPTVFAADFVSAVWIGTKFLLWHTFRQRQKGGVAGSPEPTQIQHRMASSGDELENKIDRQTPPEILRSWPLTRAVLLQDKCKVASSACSMIRGAPRSGQHATTVAPNPALHQHLAALAAVRLGRRFIARTQEAARGRIQLRPDGFFPPAEGISKKSAGHADRDNRNDRRRKKGRAAVEG